MSFKDSESKQLQLEKTKMTAARLKTFKGFEHYNDSQATSTLRIMEEFANLLCNHIQNRN
ncbi:hypothetical protein [uncultured Olleya sp.]|uniref:hypothetical protein n=1 Tax=uncultured Olleya sp. TaxID=757243 RepID=UPI0032B10104|tara:strand:- start:826 stop:1005 length:180 start_codon:yes stop_codon:yes gene_type:complete